LIIINFLVNDVAAISLYASDVNNNYIYQFSPDSIFVSDTIVSDTIKQEFFVSDTISTDSLQQNFITTDTTLNLLDPSDTIPDNEERNSIEAMVERIANDSIVQDIKNRKVYMYGEAVINYEDITLKAEYIEVDFSTNQVFASGVEDSTGKIIGTPEFTEGGQTFNAKTMSYNFDTKKGIINQVITEDDAGFLHGQKVKKLEDNTINILHGQYTTCNNKEHPHFSFRFKKSKVIPDDKIITGPAYMEIEGMPTPIGLPFGYFPNKMGQKSGIIIPTYGESTQRGFYLENGGYYWGINEYLDFQLTGDIYSRGSYAIKPKLRYKKRYKYSGSFNAGYAINVIGISGAPDYSKSTDFRIKWNHKQDPKARPRSTFTANVNIVSGNFVKYNVVNVNDYLSNEFQSSVAYQTNWASKYYLTLNASHRQNTNTHSVQVSLPELTFSVNRFYPLKKEGGKKRFYEDLSIQYSMNAKNTINTTDSMLFKAQTFRNDMLNGMVHKIPISLPLKVLKYFNLSTSINFTDRMYSQSIRKYWSEDTLFTNNDTVVGYVNTDTVSGFRNSVEFNFSTSLTTKIYGMLKFKKGPIRAVRHVFTPTFGFSYKPDFGDEKWGYYDSYVDTLGNDIQYSQFEGSLYGSPNAQKSGSLNFSFGNNLELKVPSRKDTITGLKKIVLIENLTFSGNYDLARDSMNLSFLNVQGRTKLWKNMSLNYSSRWDPYALDEDGKRTSKFEWDVNRRLFRLDNTSMNFSFNYKIGDKAFKKEEIKDVNATEDEIDEINENPNNYVNWDIPWSMDFSYNFTYTNNLTYINYIKQPDKTIIQTLSFRGQVNITPKWKVSMTSGWDFTNNQLSYTSLNLYRDLHCWEMRFNWVPIGPRKSWNFSINVKASVLQDLKLNKKKDFRDI
jgi:lipopolysaccharide assembly outer membrane protein LptD (OstA)